ncbi:hypothetical protein PUR34_08295 [Streptomyces sp. JV185]|uniref:hypothetical protein n=1 Tax=Streptomyces sp. JV185 TaxID=858638 RepID=UPI002E768D69|nr:hypothetical protein [Streptomyces sp. JV185]MEE1768175.1 hypothetical protein [Streptomyces sp. JV185]
MYGAQPRAKANPVSLDLECRWANGAAGTGRAELDEPAARFPLHLGCPPAPGGPPARAGGVVRAQPVDADDAPPAGVDFLRRTVRLVL